jgi:hypothetical protein
MTDEEAMKVLGAARWPAGMTIQEEFWLAVSAASAALAEKVGREKAKEPERVSLMSQENAVVVASRTVTGSLPWSTHPEATPSVAQLEAAAGTIRLLREEGGAWLRKYDDDQHAICDPSDGRLRAAAIFRALSCQ